MPGGRGQILTESKSNSRPQFVEEKPALQEFLISTFSGQMCNSQKKVAEVYMGYNHNFN